MHEIGRDVYVYIRIVEAHSFTASLVSEILAGR